MSLEIRRLSVVCCASLALLAAGTEMTRAAAPVLTNSLGMKLMLVPAGKFIMGAPKSEPGREGDEIEHEVTLSKPFYLAATPVTRAQFAQFVAASGYKTQAEVAKDAQTWRAPKIKQDSEQHPVVRVTWDDAMAFCKWLGGQDHRAYRLPTEAEREYACRAGTRTPFNTGATLTADQANCDGSKQPYPGTKKSVFRGTTTPVGSFPPNAWGLQDMHGNIWEWCNDFEVPYTAAAVTNPVGAAGKAYVQRGGAWNNPPQTCRSANRYRKPAANRDDFSGFRVVCDVP